MKLGITFLLVLLQNSVVIAQNTTAGTPATFDVVVSFGSVCCGTASDDFLKAYMKTYCSKNKDAIIALKLGGCGREGEYKILFALVKLAPPQKSKFISALKKLIPDENEKNKAASASSGPISLDYDLPISQFEYCREQSSKWKWEK
jgi:hypothetical protein